nr:lysine exporter LysO family protein [Neisseria meningitidis]
MDSLMTLLSVLIPMFAGFFIRVPKPYLPALDKVLSVLVYAVLLLIGVSLSCVEDLGSRLDDMALTVLWLFVCTVGANLLALAVLGKLFPWRIKGKGKGVSGSVGQLGCVLLGFASGKLMRDIWMPSESAGMYCLMLLVFLIGVQLKSSGVSLRQVLVNRRGIRLSVWFMLSSLSGGLLFAASADGVSWTKGLAMASGFGWYSLSGLVMTEAYGAVWGSIMLLNDLARELFALAFIPLLMKRFPDAAVGVGGATSMDFTLPVIQGAGGLEVVPVAVSFGVVVNIAAPFLMVVFSTLG